MDCYPWAWGFDLTYADGLFIFEFGVEEFHACSG